MTPTRALAERVGVWTLVALLMAAYVAGYLNSASIQDTARDVYYAYAIRHGVFYPLEGPILGGALHLGPAWFYLMAVPLWVHESWLATAIFAGLLASFKFPLAYACGRRMLDRRFGLLWAACLAIPGWASFETLIFFNPNAAAAAMLLPLWLALRVRDHPPSPLEGLAFGLACALALHVHPTTAPIALLAFAFMTSSRRAGASSVGLLVVIAVGAVLPFLPYAWSQWTSGMPDWSGATNYLAGQVGWENLTNIPWVLASVLWHGTAIVAVRIGGLPEASAFAFAVILAAPLAVLLLVFAGRSPAARAALSVGARLLGWSFLMAAWIAWLRPTTPAYFVYALVPFAAGLVALGLWRVPATTSGRAASVAFALLAVAAGMTMSSRMAAIVRHGEGVLTSQVLDVKEASPRSLYADTWFPASGRIALGRFLCSQPGGIALHGHLAFIVDRSVGVDALFACGKASHVVLGGRAPATPHWVGLSRLFSSRVDGRGACRIGSLELVQASSVQGVADALTIPDGRRYFPREHAKGPASLYRLEFTAPAGHALLVTNMLHGYEGLRVVRVTAAGKEIGPAASNDLSYLYTPPTGGEAVSWTVSFETTRPAAVDIVTFKLPFEGACGP